MLDNDDLDLVAVENPTAQESKKNMLDDDDLDLVAAGLPTAQESK